MADLKNTETFIGKDGLEYCSRCHTPREKTLPSPFKEGETFKVHLMCKCEREVYEAEQEARAKREFAEMVSRNRGVCFHEKKMWDWTFSNDDGSVPAAVLAKRYVESWNEMKANNMGLLLWGDVGTGKTYIATCIANALLDQGKRVLMRDFAQISNISVFDADEYANSLSSYDLLILDDLGAERTSEFALQNVFNVINRRWESGKPLIITTNLSMDELKKGEDMTHKRIYDRILAMCTPILVEGKSKRIDTAEQKYRDLKEIFGKEEPSDGND